MSIPWVTALHLVKKLLPVVIERAPELLKTFERFRTVAPPPVESTPPEPALAALQEQIEAQQRTIAMQAETIVQLHGTLSATKRALRIAKGVLAVTLLLSVAILLVLLSRS